MKRNSRIIAIFLTMVMVLSTSFAFADDGQPSSLKEYTVNYAFDLDGSPEQVKVYYSDNMLNGASTVFNEHLATASMGLCLAAGGDSDSNIATLLEDMGYANFQSNYTRAVAREDNIAFAYASKKIDGTVIIPVVIRGSHYKSEWYDNFHAGESGDAQGFSSAASTVSTAVEKYVSSLNTSKIKIWVTGYSRGAGVADLVCETLTGEYGASKVYGYCNEAPQTNLGNGNKSNIHHVRNPYDGVTLVLPDYMGFGIAGKVDAKIGDLSNEAQMKNMLSKVVKEDVDKYYVSPSGFAWAKVDTSNLLKLSSFPVVYVSSGDATEFWSTLLSRIQKVIPSRSKYVSVYSSNVSAAASAMNVKAATIEESFRGIAEYVMTMSDAEKAGIKSKLGSALTSVVMSLGLTDNPLLKMIDNTSGNTELTADQYTKVVRTFADAMNADEDMKACIAGGLEPLMTMLDIDFANPNKQVLGSLLYQDNLNRLIFPHGLEITMAWLMTQDSYYNGGIPEEPDEPEPEVKIATTKISKLTAAKKGFTVKWSKKTSNLTGYQIQYSTSSTFKSGNKTVKITKKTTTSKKITKLKAKKKYYVRIRCYKNVDGKPVYGAWSAKKSVTTKK